MVRRSRIHPLLAGIPSLTLISPRSKEFHAHCFSSCLSALVGFSRSMIGCTAPPQTNLMGRVLYALPRQLTYF